MIWGSAGRQHTWLAVGARTFALLSLMGFVFAWLLWRRETGPDGHALESIRPRSTS